MEPHDEVEHVEVSMVPGNAIEDTMSTGQDGREQQPEVPSEVRALERETRIKRFHRCRSCASVCICRP